MSEKSEFKISEENFPQRINICNSVKSIYIVKNILSHLTIIKELKLIIYNKLIQEKLEINIAYYKLKSGRYKIGKKNGLGKEFKLNTEIT